MIEIGIGIFVLATIALSSYLSSDLFGIDILDFIMCSFMAFFTVTIIGVFLYGVGTCTIEIAKEVKKQKLIHREGK